MKVLETADVAIAIVAVVLTAVECFQVKAYLFVVMVVEGEVGLGHEEILEYFVDTEYALVAKDAQSSWEFDKLVPLAALAQSAG